jgi:hypothetical protein
MHIVINYWAVIAAAAASMVVGAIWYARPVFGNTWGKLAGLKMDRPVTFGTMAPLLLTQMAASLLTAYILAHFIVFVHNYTLGEWVKDGAQTALWAWLGFTVARLAMHDMFEGRRKKLTILNAAYEVVTLVLMGVIIGWMHP